MLRFFLRRETLIIAIDGPAGSGKSTTARAVAHRLGFQYLDTGAMYRAAALAFQRARHEGQPAEPDEVLQAMNIDFSFVGGKILVLLDGDDVTDEIRRPEIGAVVSEVAARPAVRMKLVAEQRKIAHQFTDRGQGVVVDGRDIGTYVFPDADVKVFMVADARVRAHRRLKELASKGLDVSLEDVHAEIERRDELDSMREVAPLRKAEDAVELNTTDLSIDQQVDIVERLARERSHDHSV